MTRRFWVEIYEPAKGTIASMAALGEGEEASEGRRVEQEKGGHVGAKRLGVVELCTGCTARGISSPFVLRACL